MKTTVIYHSADYDGIFCREIARKFLPDAELIGWNFGDPLIPFPTDGTVYVLDLSPECLERDERNYEGGKQRDRLVWIDHHKTAIDRWPRDIAGYRIDGVAACRLAWQWFQRDDFYHGDRRNEPIPDLPLKQEYVERSVTEPLAVRLAGEYDIWDKRDPRAETLQYGLRVRELTSADWSSLLSMRRPSIEELEGLIAVGHAQNLLEPDGKSVPPILWTLLENGKIAQTYARHTDASICNFRTWLMKWEGLKFLCVNSARFNSLLFAAKDIPETGHDALLGFCFDGKCWTVSLYHAAHRKDLDLSEIAKRHGGGGHRGACGFTSKQLPFNLDVSPPALPGGNTNH